MAKKRKSPSSASPGPTRPAAWETPEGRVQWLVNEHYGGNRSAFAQAVGFSHTAINFVMQGKAPGRKLLTAVAERLHVSAAWLLTGAGVPFLSMPGGSIAGVPIAERPLPGPPEHFRGLLTDEWIDDTGKVFTPTQYWLRLRRGDAILREPTRGFCAGDLLLMECDRQRFPEEANIAYDLCVVNLTDAKAKDVRCKLGLVLHFDADANTDEHLEVDTFDFGADPENLVREDVYQTFPNQEVKHLVHYRRILDPHRPKAKEQDVAPKLEIVGLRIEYADIVGVWTRILRRSYSAPLL